MKLISKTRIRSTVRKHHDDPQTPCERLLAHPDVSPEVKEKLAKQLNQLNPAQLKRTIAQLQESLFASHSPLPPRPAHITIPRAYHPWRQTDPRCKNLLLPPSARATIIDSITEIHDTPPSASLKPHPPP